MRKRDREKIVKNIELGIESKQGRPISVRPYEEDHKKLEEIAAETGENKSAIVRRMIHFALTDRHQHFASGRCQEKLDWLVRTGRQNETIELAVSDNIGEIRESIDRMESELENAVELLRQASSLTTEIYSMSSMSISSLNLVFTKLIEYTSTETSDRKQSVVIASTAMAELIEHAVSDLKKCLLFHEHVSGNESLHNSYLATKVRILKQRIDSLPKPANQIASESCPGPVVPPKPPAPSFSEQIKNLMRTGQEWLFQSVLNTIIKPLMPILMFLAWIIASFVLILAFIRRFHDNRGLGPEQLVAWAIRSIIFMVLIGASPFIIDGLTITGKFFARPIRAYNRSLVTEFDDKMKKYVKANFAVEDPNALLAERLPNGEPGLVGIIMDKESTVKDITGELSILGWNLPRMFTFMVIGQNIIKFGGLFLAIAGLFILIGLKLAAPVLAAFGFDEKFAAQMFYPFCWGVATFALAFPIVKEVTLYVCYGLGVLALSIYNGEATFSLDPVTAKIITNGAYDPASSALIVTALFFVSSLCFILVPWLSYRVLRGQVYEGVSQISMGWMLSSMGTALETYGLVAGAAINRQAENTQIQGIYNAEQTAARKSLEAANQSTDARLVSSVAGVEGGLTTSLGQIRANQVTQTLLAEASKNYGLSSSAAATKREIAGTLAEAQGTREARTIDGMKEVELRGQGNLERFGMKTYEFTPGGSSIAGTSVPIRTGQELFDWSRNKHPIQEVNKQMDSTTRSNIALQNNNTGIVADTKVEASNVYQGEINQALETQASQSKQAFNTGSSIASSSTRQGAGIQLSGIRRSADMEKVSNQLNFEGRTEAASINQTAAMEAARLRMVSSVVTGFFRDMDRRLEEMKPKY